MEGWVKLSRSLIDKPLFQNEKLLKVWIWCLLKATHKGYRQLIGLKKINLESGQFIFGRQKASDELNMSPSTVWRLMNFLKDNQSLDIKTNNKYSLISLINWDVYQVKTKNMDSKTDNKKTREEQQMDTNKNVENVENDKNYIYSAFTNSKDLLESVKSFIEMRKSLKKPMTDNAIKIMLNKLNKLANDDSTKIEILNQSIMNSWTGIYELKQQNLFSNQSKKSKADQDMENLEEMLRINDRSNVIKNSQNVPCQLS